MARPPDVSGGLHQRFRRLQQTALPQLASPSGASSPASSSGPPSTPSSTPSSVMRSTETTFSSSAVSNTVTPCVARPAMRMPATGHADQLAAIGDQHDLVALLDREGRHQPAVAVVDRHGADALAAAAGDAEFVGRGALAVAVLRQREDELLVRAEIDIALLRQPDVRPSSAASSASRPRQSRRLFARGLAGHGAAHLEIGGALVGATRRHGAGWPWR